MEETNSKLEKIVQSEDKRKLSQKDIEIIINSYETYNGNATKASENLPYNIRTIIKYWREAEFEIRRRGNNYGCEDLERYNQIRELLEEGYSQSEIARKLGVSHQAIDSYTNYHNFPRTNIKKKREKIRQKRIISLINQNLTRKEIAMELGISYESLIVYLSYHKKLPRPQKENLKGEIRNEERYNKIRELLEEGYSQLKIGQILGYASKGIITNYMRTHPELREIYDSKRNKK